MADASWANVVQFTTYLVIRRTFQSSWHSQRDSEDVSKRKIPPNTLLMVDRLVKEPFLVEVQTIAAI